MGQALMGQPVGAEVSYQAPAGEIRLTVLSIE
jgi:transcription elongation GreA/GreB family factor